MEEQSHLLQILLTNLQEKSHVIWKFLVVSYLIIQIRLIFLRTVIDKKIWEILYKKWNFFLIEANVILLHQNSFTLIWYYFLIFYLLIFRSTKINFCIDHFKQLLPPPIKLFSSIPSKCFRNIFCRRTWFFFPKK